MAKRLTPEEKAARLIEKIRRDERRYQARKQREEERRRRCDRAVPFRAGFQLRLKSAFVPLLTDERRIRDLSSYHFSLLIL